jgi:hypothetical protein
VKPVWPTDRAGKNGAWISEYPDDMSQPSVRLPLPSLARAHIRSIVSPRRNRRPFATP